MSILKWLEEWYESNCDGDWEHQFGLSLNTLDNPGWCLRLDLNYTLFEDVIFPEVLIDRSEYDWVRCIKKGSSIECTGGSKNLEEMLSIVKKWMDSNPPDSVAAEKHMQEVMKVRNFHESVRGGSWSYSG